MARNHVDPEPGKLESATTSFIGVDMNAVVVMKRKKKKNHDEKRVRWESCLEFGKEGTYTFVSRTRAVRIGTLCGVC